MQLLPKIPLPQLLLPQELLQPQFVAVKSLIFSASTFYLCFIVCGGACQCFRKRLAIIFGYSTIKLYSHTDMRCDGLHSFDKVIKDK